jgi:hypothetical protein
MTLSLLYPSARCARSSQCRIFTETSQANKYLHDLAFTQSVWSSLVEDLRNRSFVDRLSSSDTGRLSTPELVALVKRLVFGPETWSSLAHHPRSKSFSNLLRKFAAPFSKYPKLSRTKARIVLHPKLHPNHGVRLDDLQLLCGGMYVLFHDGHVLQCWRVTDDSLLCTYQSPAGQLLHLEAEMLDGGERARLVICAGSNFV